MLGDKSRLQALAQSGLNGSRCRQVYLDIGGDRSLHMIARMIPLLEQTIQPDLIVVKSEELKTHADRWLEQQPGQPAGDVIEDAGWWWAALREHCETIEGVGGRRVVGALVGALTGQLGGTAGRLMHPLKYPHKRTTAGVDICRFFNYSACKKGSRCPLDHTTCHCCGAEGHTASACRAFS